MGKSETHKEDNEVIKKFNEKVTDVKDWIKFANQMDYGVIKKGRIITDNQETYEGNKNEEGLPHGFGRMVLKGGNTYEGNFVNGIAQGLGNYMDAEITYAGEFNKGEPNGKVVIKKTKTEYELPYTYEGDVITFNMGMGEYFIICPFGFGISQKNGKTYIGEFKDTLTCLTHVIYEDKSTFDGWFAISYNSQLGFGIRKYNNGDVYKGFCLKGEPRGMGILTKKNGGNKIWSDNYMTDNKNNLVVPTDAKENSKMECMIDAALAEIINMAKLEEVVQEAKKTAKEAIEKAKEAIEKAKEANKNAVKEAKKTAKEAIEKAKEANKNAVKEKFAKKLEEVKKNIEFFNNFEYKKESEQKGTINTANQTKYEGEINEGMPHGFGRMELKDGSKYEGYFSKGMAQGLGKYEEYWETIELVQRFFGLYNQEKIITKTLTYTGEFRNGEPNGSVVIESGSEYIYEGDVLSFTSLENVSITKFGYGTAQIDGNQHIGEFKNVLSGLTHDVYKDTSTFDGWLVNTGNAIGIGIRTYKNGDVYKGFCRYGQPIGMGVYIKKSGGGSKIWSENFDGNNIPDDGVQNDEMETMIDNAIKEIMNETKINEVQTKAKAAAEKAKAAAEKAKAAAEKANAEKANAEKANADKEKAEKAKADEAYTEAIVGATPKEYDAKKVTTVNRADGVHYVGHVKGDKPIGFGKITYPNYCTYTGSFINNSEPEGLGKIEYLDNSGSPLKEYYGFVKGPSPHGYGLGVYKEGQKEEYHVKWLNMQNTVLQAKKEYFDKDYDDKNPELLQKIKENIKRDAEKFVDMVPKVAEEEPSGSAKEESHKPGNLRGTSLTSENASFKSWNLRGPENTSPKSRNLRGPENTSPKSGTKEETKKETKEESSKSGTPQSTWGKKEYGLAAAAAGIGAAGIYYAFKNSKRKSKSKHRSKSKRKSKSKRRSKRERRSKSKDSSE
jgi:hypothetical protein